MSKQYLSCAETAKLIRVALKESFPGVKFSVTSSVYSGGASINIKYSDGPAFKDVQDVARVFEGSYFDGMQDYKGQNYSAIDGQEVRFGADFVFVTRRFSAEFLQGVADSVAQKYGVQGSYEIVAGSSSYGAYVNCDNSMLAGGRLFCQQVNLEASEISLCPSNAANSAMLARISSLGDDGYGMGCVGRLAA